jgi:hypothetical protein
MKNYMVKGGIYNEVVSAKLEIAKIVAAVVPSTHVVRNASVWVNVATHLMMTNKDNGNNLAQPYIDIGKAMEMSGQTMLLTRCQRHADDSVK